MKHSINYILFISLAAIALSSCKKDWLDAKSNQQLVIPSTLQDCQAILDNSAGLFNSQPSLGETGSDNFYVLYTTWQANSVPYDNNQYIWAQDIFAGNSCLDWNYPYEQVFYANNVFTTLAGIALTANTQAEWNNIKGSALFARAYAFYNIASLFCKPYITATAATDPGIVLKLTAQTTENPPRSSVQATYNRITGDLKEAATLLPDTAAYKTRPSKAAAYAMLARVYLSMRSYDSAGIYADSALAICHNLLDFNQLNAASSTPIPRFNAEVIYHSILRTTLLLRYTSAIVDSTLLASYTANDLRSNIYFYVSGGYPRYKFAYSGSTVYSFGGLVTDELYLIKAECEARAGDAGSDYGLDDLNTLLVTRWKTGTFVPFAAATADDALNIILTERRKELLFRGIRWTDLRRLNQEPGHTVTLTRILNGQTYTLSPGDDRYVLPIPPDEIAADHIEQNPR